MICVLKDQPLDAWRIFLEKDPQATLFHTPEWKSILERTFKYTPSYLFATNDAGDLIGLLPMFLVRSKLTGDRLSCVPFAQECWPIGKPDVKRLLIEEAINIAHDQGVASIEIKDAISHNGFITTNYFSKNQLHLTPNIDMIWQNLAHNIRRGIKKAKTVGVSVDISDKSGDLRAFYELNCQNKRNIGVPGHPWRLFENLVRYMKPNIRLFVAKYQSEVVAGAIMMVYRNYMLYAYGASNPGALKLYPNNALFWKSIENAANEGFKVYDFGRTSYENLGLLQYKRRWGTEENPLYYSYYPRPRYVDRSGNMVKISSALIRYMPMAVYKRFSDIIFGNFG